MSGKNARMLGRPARAGLARDRGGREPPDEDVERLRGAGGISGEHVDEDEPLVGQGMQAHVAGIEEEQGEVEHDDRS